MAFDLQFWINHDHSAECFDRFPAKAGAALRRVGISGSETPTQRLPWNKRRPRQIANPARRPGVKIEGQRRPLESSDGPQIKRNRSSDELLKEAHGKGH